MEGHKKMDTKLVLEAAEREKKYFKVYQDFTPNPKAESLMLKFYARHERLRTDEDPPEEYMELIKKFKDGTPKDRLLYPETENQRYGWYSKTFCNVRNNNKLSFCGKFDKDIKLSAEVKQALKKEKPFEGVPFRL